jgi:hypothetical protein
MTKHEQCIALKILKANFVIANEKLVMAMKQHNNSDPTLSYVKKLNTDMFSCNAELSDILKEFHYKLNTGQILH